MTHDPTHKPGERGKDAATPSDQFLLNLVSQLPALVWTTDGQLGLVMPLSLSSAHERPEEWVGKRVVALFGDDPTDTLDRHERALAGQHCHFEFSLRGRHFEGQISPRRDDAGQIIGTVGVALDMTDRRHFDAQLQMSRKMEVIGRLAGGMAHDFNNVLTIITSYAQFLLDRFEPADEPHEDAQVIHDAARRASNLVSKLLAFSRRQVLRPQVVDLNDMLNDLQKMLQGLLSEHVELSTVFHVESCPVRVDQGQIEQVLMNLVVNAQDAMPEGGKLVIETDEVDLDETFAENHVGIVPGPHVLLSVSDTGVGMTKDVLAQIFEPFFTTKRESKGTGLGLATAYGIVRQSNGTLWVYSEPGIGTTFKLYFPRAGNTPSTRPRRRTTPPMGRGDARILVVEDDEGVLSGTTRTLSNHGYEVLRARSGAEAHTLCRSLKAPVDLVLSDVVMPEMNGVRLRAWLQETWPKTPVLLMSGYSTEAVAALGVNAKQEPFLAKPFSPNALLRSVHLLLHPSDDA